jgi:hypothetical protein
MWYIYHRGGASTVSRRIIFAVRAWTPAQAAAVYHLLQDGATWPSWSPIGSYRLEREGKEGGDGEGAIRVFTTSGVRTREEVLGLQPGRAFTYAQLTGLPIRAHRATVELEHQDGGTGITWHEAFEPVIPGTGWLLRWFLHGFVQRCADGLAEAAGRDPAVREGRAASV